MVREEREEKEKGRLNNVIERECERAMIVQAVYVLSCAERTTTNRIFN